MITEVVGVPGGQIGKTSRGFRVQQQFKQGGMFGMPRCDGQVRGGAGSAMIGGGFHYYLGGGLSSVMGGIAGGIGGALAPGSGCCFYCCYCYCCTNRKS